MAASTATDLTRARRIRWRAAGRRWERRWSSRPERRKKRRAAGEQGDVVGGGDSSLSPVQRRLLLLPRAAVEADPWAAVANLWEADRR